MSEQTKTIGEQLRDPFPLASLGFKPQMVKNNRALAVPYIDARDVAQRLDDVVGIENWSDDYVPLGDGQVMCKLSVCIGGKWVTKCDVGGESEQPDKGDREKAAFSDALKRAAVKFGIGRYLYSMPSQWCDYDQVKKQFSQTPSVPAKFLPAGEKPAPQQKPQPAPAPKVEQQPERDEFLYLLEGVKTAGSQPSLAAAWEEVNVAARANRLTPDQRKELEQAKDDRKAALARPRSAAGTPN